MARKDGFYNSGRTKVAKKRSFADEFECRPKRSHSFGKNGKALLKMGAIIGLGALIIKAAEKDREQ